MLSGEWLEVKENSAPAPMAFKRDCLDFPLGRLLVFPQFAHGLLRTMQSRANHPILDFGIEESTLRYAGSDLQPRK